MSEVAHYYSKQLQLNPQQISISGAPWTGFVKRINISVISKNSNEFLNDSGKKNSCMSIIVERGENVCRDRAGVRVCLARNELVRKMA